jgi:prophage antirepressor-like protein
MDHSNIIPFAFEDNLVRIVMRDGEPWFVATDVCRVLGLSYVTKTLERLDDDEKGLNTIQTPGGEQQANIVSESGLYALIFTSRKAEARAFRKWVTAEVLPAIRKTGGYDALEALAAAQPRGATADWPVAELNANVAMVREARSLFGVAAARQLWEMTGLPTCVTASHPDQYAEAEGLEALERILDAAHNDRLIRDWLAEAIEGDQAARRSLAPIGVVVNDRDDGVVFACSTSFLNSLFKGHARHYLALRMISGARARVRAYFGPVQGRGVLIPMDTVDNMLHGLRDAA